MNGFFLLEQPVDGSQRRRYLLVSFHFAAQQSPRRAEIKFSPSFSYEHTKMCFSVGSRVHQPTQHLRTELSVILDDSLQQSRSRRGLYVVEGAKNVLLPKKPDGILLHEVDGKDQACTIVLHTGVGQKLHDFHVTFTGG